MPTYKTRFITPKYTLFIVVVGFGMLGGGIASFFLLDSIIVGIILMILGIYLALSHTGIDVDLKKRRFRSFTSHFGLKEGNWKFFKYYPYLSILTINQKHTKYSHTGVPFSSKFKVFRVYLLNEKHTDKILIKEFRNKVTAEEYINRLAEELSLKVDIYSPDFN